jgi:hypothetical protein
MWKRVVVTGLLALNLFTAIGLFPATAYAAQEEYCRGTGTTFLGFPTWYRYVYEWDGTSCKVNVGLDNPKSLSLVMLAVFEIVLRIGGIAAVIYVVYGGFQYIIARAEPDRARGARTTIQNALIGLVITLFASAIVNLIARSI